MKNLIVNTKKSLIVCLTLSVFATLVHADDTEVFFSTNVSKPNLLFVLDVSGSMNTKIIGSGTPGSTVKHTISRKITHVNGDAEQNVSGGHVVLHDRYLDLGYDYYGFRVRGVGAKPPGQQRVGLHFYDIEIPQGAQVTKAYIQFQVRDTDQYSSLPASLKIYAEAATNPKRFSNGLADRINSRTFIQKPNTDPAEIEIVDWNPPIWQSIGDKGDDQKTSDLSVFVQNLIDRGSWDISDNAITFVIEGAEGNVGSRIATSRNSSRDNAPTLHIEYTTIGVGGDKSRLEVMQTAIKRVLELAPDNVNVGLMNYGEQNHIIDEYFLSEEHRNHSVSGVVLPISDINALASSVIYPYDSVDNLPTPNTTTTVREYIADIVDGWRAHRSSFTPIVDSLYEAALYFRGEKMHYGQTIITKGGAHPASYEGDSLFPDVLTTARDHANAPNYINPIKSSCQSNYIVLMSDGAPTYAYPSGASQAHHLGPFASVMKGDSSWSNLAGAITSCESTTLGAGTCGSEITHYLASHDNSSEYDGDQTIDTYTIGFGNSLSDDAVDYLKSLETIDDDISTVSTVEDGYFNADSPEELAQAFRDILDQVSAPTGTLASPGYSVNVKSGLEHEKDIYIPVFDRKNTSRWSGNLKKFSIVEEGNKRLIRGKNDLNAVDNLGGFTVDAWDHWSDTPEDEGPDGISIEKGGVAGKINPEGRLVVSNLTGNKNLINSANLVKPSNKLINNALLGIDPSSSQDSNSGQKTREKLISFIRGWKGGNYDEDASPKGTPRKHMGDMLHSEPLIITYQEGNDNGEGKVQYIFAGTNEGFLHAFDTKTGEEKFAFMPKELLKNIEPQMRNEGTAEDHKYGIDGALSYWKFTDNLGKEKVYLYFGLRRGGSSYYALDVTNIKEPKFLWKAEYPTMGQSWSIPYLGRIRHSGSQCKKQDGVIIENCKDVVVISGGYDDVEDRDGDEAARDVSSLVNVGKDILILDAKDGDKLWSLREDLDDSSIVDSIPGGVRILDTNRNGLLDRFYFADTGGNVWRLDLDEIIDENDTTKLTHLASLGNGGRQESRKFYNEPDVSVMKLNGQTIFVVSIGSGFRAHPMDLSIDDKFYMLIDDKPYSKIVDDEFETILPSKLSLITISASSNDGSAAINKVVNQVGQLDSEIGDTGDFVKGWEVTLPEQGEKILGVALAFDGVIVFTTLVPEPLVTGDGVDQCAAPSSQGRLYGINVRTGAAGLDLNGDGVLNDNDVFSTVSKGEIPGKPQVVFNALEVKDVLDENDEATGDKSCRHPVDIRIGKKLSQATGYDSCRLESLYWSDPVKQN